MPDSYIEISFDNLEFEYVCNKNKKKIMKKNSYWAGISLLTNNGFASNIDGKHLDLIRAKQSIEIVPSAEQLRDSHTDKQKL